MVSSFVFRHSSFLTLTAALGGLAACQPAKPSSPALTGTGMDMFAPTALHIHHLSRIVPPATAPATAPATTTLEAHIELSDQFADTTKTTGTLRIELFDQPPLTHKGPLLESRTVTIATPQDHQAYWDRITRTYTIRFPLANLPRNRDHLLLSATLTLPNGTTLTDEYELPLK